MASRFLQKYYLPENFQEVLSELVREVLRAQPDDIIDFLANYCEARAQGKDYEYQSIYNVKERQIPDQPPKEYYQNMEERAKLLVKSSNKQNVVMVPSKNTKQRTLFDDLPEPTTLQGEQQQYQENPNDKGIGTDNNQQQENIQNEEDNQEQQNQLEDQQQQQDEEQNNEANQEQQQENQEDKQSQQRSQSAQSQGKVSNATSHPEEKGIGKQFVGDLYSSALNNIQQSGLEEKDKTEAQEQLEFAKEVQENQEQFDQAARFIQNKYKQQKAKEEKK